MTKLSQKLYTSIISAVAKSNIKNSKICFEVTGINQDGENGIMTYNNGKMDQLEELLEYFQSLQSGTLWLTDIRRDNTLGKRILVCRKGEKYLASK